MKDSDRATRRYERNLERRVKNEGAAAGPVGQNIIRENIGALADAIDGVEPPLGPIGEEIVAQDIRPLLDLIERVRVKRPTRETLLQNALNRNVWDLIHEVPTKVLVKACLAGVLNYGRVPLRADEKPSVARSMNLIGKELQLHVEASAWRPPDLKSHRASFGEFF